MKQKVIDVKVSERMHATKPVFKLKIYLEIRNLVAEFSKSLCKWFHFLSSFVIISSSFSIMQRVSFLQTC